jgi:small conductance mechanosensitive channel
LAGAGIIGVAISFASQSLIKDMINGFFILLEDQYGVGDVIIVGEVSGLVENMNLRITQLRNDEGRLITIPNSAITIVQNLSKEWSRVDLRIDVAYSADIDQALALIEQVAHDMSRDRPWSDLILEPPLLLGVDKLDHAGATVRLWIKTQPLKQWEVAREYRRRLKLAFDKAGIPFGVPQQSLLLHSDDDEADAKKPPLTQVQGK